MLVSGFGLWAIWRPVLPAFRILNDVALWTYTITVDGVDKIEPVTLNDGILGLLLIVIGIIAARRLPALMEIVLLARLNITAGSRYAIASMTQYAIVAVVIVMVFDLIGGSWSEIQWLIAALGVGIGFGLQEIVANFICGLILLFERPVRIGDIVTVGETSGIVTRIQIRSTTVRNWDQQELLVPNKEFITGRLLNWTLSDPMARIVVPVGIAYGSDVGLAIKLIQETAEQNERILEDPVPLVTFDSFGDNALNIVLRCYIASMDYRLLTQSELNETINQKFANAGISIAFPQRDIHLDTSQPLDIRIHQAQPES
jgi:potassium efflux system protein